MTTADVLADGLYFGEGPRWHDGRLWFSDFYDHAVKTCTVDGVVETVVEVPNPPSGLGWMPDGTLLIVSMTDRKLLRWTAGGGLREHADLSGIATWHCNDMVVDSAGRAYVGNFGFDLDDWLMTRGIEDTILHSPTAVLARVDPDGSVHAVADELRFPNGTVITPDGRTLIVAETVGSRLTAFDVADDGSLANRRVWCDLGGHVPDGICLDAEERIWFANPLEPACMLVAEETEVLDVIETSQTAYACMLGGDDGRTMFILTAGSSLASVASATRTGRIEVARVEVPHAGLP
jgi:sugar lactone lactonase YvrE